MPEVLTHKELKKFYEEAQPELKKSVVLQKKVVEGQLKIDYYYLYPDNVQDRWYNGKYIVDYEGKRNELTIKSGVVKTNDIKISECLKKQGFIFMYEKEAINE